MANPHRIESFQGLTAFTDWDAKHAGSHTSGAGDSISTTSAGRNGGYGCRLADDGRLLSATFDATATAYTGFGVTVASPLAGNGTSTTVIVQFFDTATLHIRILMSSLGEIVIQRNTTELARSATGVVVTGVSAHWEFKVTIADAGGVAEVLKNGVSVVSFSGDTRNAGNASVNKIQWNGWSANVNTDISDLYYGATGAYWGDGTVAYLAPNGNGNSSQWVGSDGNSTDNYLLVDETPYNDDTDYVTSGTPGDKDTYAFGNLAVSSGTVQTVQLSARFRKDDAGARSIVTVARLSATETDSAVVTAGSTYGYATDSRTTKPGGGSWSITDVNNAEFGVKVNA